MSDVVSFEPQCPLPHTQHNSIQLGHGSGGKLTHQLIQDVFYPYFSNPYLSQVHDGALFQIGNEQLVFTTDSYVVRPLFFPGGDIGKLSVFGTVNDLAMGGAKPLYLSCGFILEEGFSIETLSRIVQSMQLAAQSVGVQLVTGDTKVVERGKGDGLYLNTSGIGVCEHRFAICPQSIRTRDQIILSGDIGRHGMAVMAMREGLEFENPLESDCAELWSPVRLLLQAGIEIHCLRDLTRGGLATALVELAETSGNSIEIEEVKIPIESAVQGACEMLGLDPHYVANEGRFIAFVPEQDAERAVAILRQHPCTKDSQIIGRVLEENKQEVVIVNTLGCERLLDRLPGDQLPRIC